MSKQCNETFSRLAILAGQHVGGLILVRAKCHLDRVTIFINSFSLFSQPGILANVLYIHIMALYLSATAKDSY